MRRKVIRNSPGRESKNNKKTIQDTEAWQAADFRYCSMIAHEMMPLFEEDKMTWEERAAFLEEIISECEDYYPALLEMGFRNIREGKDEIALSFIDKGLQTLRTHFDLDTLLKAYYRIGDELESSLRFETAIEYYNQLLEIDEDKSGVLELIAACLAFMGDADGAVDYQRKALELNPNNHRHYCNMGWFEMIRGNLDEARQALEKALQLNDEDNHNVNNYKICKYMIMNDLKDWDAYLLNDIDDERLEQMNDDEEELEKEIKRYNIRRMEAFKLFMVRNKHYDPARAYDNLFTLEYTMDTISELQSPDVFLYEDIDTLFVQFRSIMYGIILRTSDMDEELLNNIYSVLQEFYRFLSERGLISEYQKLEALMTKEKPGLIDKINRYREIRHDTALSDDQKQTMRRRIFGDIYFD
ncbi:MAG TPA: hypothetical protein DCE14_08565 [Kosmotogaceae bacterium]|nr:hypothetical protein [Kosmotogaceae bacterium]